MSKLRTAKNDDHPEAACRHLGDAQALLAQQRADGAAYMSGYVTECALKSLWLLERKMPPQGHMPWAKNKGHDLTYLTSVVSALATITGAKTAKYFRTAVRTIPSSPLAGWDPGMRYRPSAMTQGDAQAWYRSAQSVFQETIAQMQLDGVL